MRMCWGKAVMTACLALGLTASARAELIYGITAALSTSTGGSNLVSFDSATPGTITNIGALSGALPNHAVRSIDFRPNGAQLYAISTDTTSLSTAQMYTVDVATGVLTPQGGTFSLTGNTSSIVRIDFNPAADRLRITTGGATNNNYRWNPVASAFVAQDTSLSFAVGDPNAAQPTITMTGTAYTNNFPGTTSTTLYGWEYQRDSIVTIGSIGGSPNSPNGGIMNTVFTAAPSFRTLGNQIGMDISANGIAFVNHDDPGLGTPHGLFMIDLSNGNQTPLGDFGSTLMLDIAAATVPEPTSMALCGLAIGGFGLRTWRKRKNATAA